MISVCIPVGPDPHYKQYLPECLDSLQAQTLPPADVLIVDDMAGLEAEPISPEMGILTEWTIGGRHPRVWRSPWRLGIPGCSNVALAMARTDLAFHLSCDDRLMPRCVEMLWAEWQRRQDQLGFYWVDIEYSTGERQSLPTGHAMIHKELWRHTGGYPIESGVGACDHIFINMLMSRPEAGRLWHVPGGPLYWHREHELQYTKNQKVHPATIADVREGFAKTWAPPLWGRYEP